MLKHLDNNYKNSEQTNIIVCFNSQTFNRDQLFKQDRSSSYGLYQSQPNHYQFQYSTTNQKRRPHNHIPISTWVINPSIVWISIVQIPWNTCEVNESWWWWWCLWSEILWGWILWSLWWRWRWRRRWRWWRLLLPTWVHARACSTLQLCICFLMIRQRISLVQLLRNGGTHGHWKWKWN